MVFNSHRLHEIHFFYVMFVYTRSPAFEKTHDFVLAKIPIPQKRDDLRNLTFKRHTRNYSKSE